uniref:Protein DD3-3 n=1 Tax=Clytia hemisphaerica TaxID=252671 RepID=A0A7M5TSE9_9CNID
MSIAKLSAAILATILISCNCDMYLHNPRGSNNRLNEASANRANPNRAFDSQNNNRGGYNVGDRTAQKAGNNKNNQYQMEYFTSGPNAGDVTKLLIEWTNQHSCGGDNKDDATKTNCDIVLQYMDVNPTKPKDLAYNAQVSEGGVRDGVQTNQQNYNANAGEKNKNGQRRFTEAESTAYARRRNSVNPNLVYQEPFEWYDKCQKRPRNKGLFTADQNVQQDRATHTRQNPGGTRRGYECPEERDYWPYWHPTGWKDIAILTKRVDKCDFFKKESFNVKPKGECVEKYPNSKNHRHYSGADTPANCTALGGEWVDFHNYLEIGPQTTEAACNAAGPKHEWAIPYRHLAYNRKQKACLVKLTEPECLKAPWSRQNHLGNGRDTNAEANRYEWTLPHFPHLNANERRAFVFRIRYNISTDDYDPYNTNSSSNGGEGVSPVTNNPLVDVGSHSPLQLAINTAQFGRTFQDRSHLSFFTPRPKGIKGVIHNLNVRGKRGNIVQTFPAVEYDFMPTVSNISQPNYVHIQWTGSNSHNNGNPGGDGQTGDAGQGTGGTDRNNILGLTKKNDNFPQLMEDENNICHHMEVVWQRTNGLANDKMKWRDICVKLGSSGYYDCKTGCTNSLDRKAKMDNLLNNAPASFSGMLVRFKKKGTFYFLCTRNNNFTNRSQKGEIIVS